MTPKYSIVEAGNSKDGKCYLFRLHEGADPIYDKVQKPVTKGIPHLFLGDGFVVMYDARDAITFCNFLNSTSNNETK